MKLGDRVKQANEPLELSLPEIGRGEPTSRTPPT